MGIGATIRDLRKGYRMKGGGRLSQQGLVTKAKDHGFEQSLSWLKAIEQGRGDVDPPDRKACEALAKALGVPGERLWSVAALERDPDVAALFRAQLDERDADIARLEAEIARLAAEGEEITRAYLSLADRSEAPAGEIPMLETSVTITVESNLLQALAKLKRARREAIRHGRDFPAGQIGIHVAMLVGDATAADPFPQRVHALSDALGLLVAIAKDAPQAADRVVGVWLEVARLAAQASTNPATSEAANAPKA